MSVRLGQHQVKGAYMRECNECRTPVATGRASCPRCGASLYEEPILEDLTLDIGETKPERFQLLKYVLLGVFLAEVVFAVVYAMME